MRARAAYRRHSRRGRRQTPEFGRRDIDGIPEGALLPFPIAGLE